MKKKIKKQALRRTVEDKKTKTLKRKRKTAARRVVKQKLYYSPRKSELAVVFVKAEENPIISPKPENNWENWQTFNPGVILLDDKVHILYRAIGEDGISRLGYAVSYDGFQVKERLSFPVYQEQLKQ